MVYIKIHDVEVDEKELVCLKHQSSEQLTFLLFAIQTFVQCVKDEYRIYQHFHLSNVQHINTCFITTCVYILCMFSVYIDKDTF